MFAPRVARLKPNRASPPPAVAVRQPGPSSVAPPAPLGIARDFSALPLHAPGRGETGAGDSRAIGDLVTMSDPLEREADQAAARIMARPGPDIGSGAASSTRPAAGAPVADRTAPPPTSFRGRGDPLAAPVRGFFEREFGHDFSGVRLHQGPDAALSAASLGARAYTYGRDIVLGAGALAAGPGPAKTLLAHELAHVVQQWAGRARVQRSPLSDSVKDAWKADPRADSLLARLSQPDVQTAQADADVDAEIGRLLAARPDDLWVALRVRKGELGKTTGALGPKVGGKPVARSIKATFIRGSTDRRALVIAGVHGTERQGIEVAERLTNDLRAAQKPPGFSTIIVPSLFPDNAATGPLGKREGDVPTNRNFPPASEDLAAATAAGGGTAVDASTKGGKRARAILPENLLLLELMERFKPERIISIHGTWRAGAAGVFYDRRSLTAAEVQGARAWAKGMAYMGMPTEQQDRPGGREELQALEERLFRGRLAQLSGEAETADRDLSLQAATQIDTATAAIPGREKREMIRETEPKPPTETEKKARKKHPSIAGNVGPTGAIDHATWTGKGTGGVSLGEYAPPRGMSVFTVEPPINRASADYPTAADKISEADRKIELQAYADAIRTILLGGP